MASSFLLLLVGSLILTIQECELAHLDPKYDVNWLVQENSQTILFKIVAQTRGWLGFGLNDQPLMEGASMAVCGVDDGGKGYLNNLRGGKDHVPPVKGNDKNFELLKSSENATHTTVYLRRKLENGHPKDHAIVAGKALYVLWAICDTDAANLANFNIHTLKGVKKGTLYKKATQ